MLPTRALARARGREWGGRGAGAGGGTPGCGKSLGNRGAAAEAGGRTVGTATAVKGQPWAWPGGPARGRLRRGPRGGAGGPRWGGRRASLLPPPPSPLTVFLHLVPGTIPSDPALLPVASPFKKPNKLT